MVLACYPVKLNWKVFFQRTVQCSGDVADQRRCDQITSPNGPWRSLSRHIKLFAITDGDRVNNSCINTSNGPGLQTVCLGRWMNPKPARICLQSKISLHHTSESCQFQTLQRGTCKLSDWLLLPYTLKWISSADIKNWREGGGGSRKLASDLGYLPEYCWPGRYIYSFRQFVTLWER